MPTNPNPMTTPDELTREEQEQLATCEKVISGGLSKFVEVGRALIAIHEHRLYRASYKSFESYCREKWGMSRGRAYQLIGAVKVIDVVSTSGEQIPATERQARELATLPEDKQVEVWSKAQEKAVAENRPVETGDIREAAAEISAKPQSEDSKWQNALGGIKSVEEFTAPTNALELGRFNGCCGRISEIEETMDAMTNQEYLEKLHHRLNGLAAKARKLAHHKHPAAA